MLEPVSRASPAHRRRRPIAPGTLLFHRAALAVVLTLATVGCAKSDRAASTGQRLAETRLGLDSVRLVAARDATIRSSTPNRNFGSGEKLEINRSLVEFDTGALRNVLGPHDYVISARLELLLTKNDLAEERFA